MAIPKMNSDQMRWQAEADAETMARYEEIMGNAKRRNAAVKVARQKATDLSKRADVMNRVSRSDYSSKTSKNKK